MAFMTPEVNGARQELPCLESPEINGARQEVAAVEKYVDGVWKEVWSAAKEMIRDANYTTLSQYAGVLDISDDGTEFDFWEVFSEEDSYGRLTSGGTIDFYLEGEWTNPVIEFDFEGQLLYKGSSTANFWITEPMGSIGIRYRNTNGSSSVMNAVNQVGSNQTSADGNVSVEGVDYGHYRTTLSGTFTMLGIRITINNHSSKYTADNLFGELQISNLTIDGRKCLFPSDYEFNAAGL